MEGEKSIRSKLVSSLINAHVLFVTNDASVFIQLTLYFVGVGDCFVTKEVVKWLKSNLQFIDVQGVSYKTIKKQT